MSVTCPPARAEMAGKTPLLLALVTSLTDVFLDMSDALFCGRHNLTLMPTVDHILLPALDAPGVHQLSLASGDQHDAALVLQGTHKGAPAHLTQPTPAHQVPHQLHHPHKLSRHSSVPSICVAGVLQHHQCFLKRALLIWKKLLACPNSTFACSVDNVTVAITQHINKLEMLQHTL